MDQLDQELMARGSNARLLAGADNTAADGIDLAATAVAQVSVDAGQAVGRLIADFLDLGALFVIVEVDAQACGSIHRVAEPMPS